MVKSTLILGGTGLLGYHTALALLEAGHSVASVSTGSADPASWYPSEAVLHQGDVISMSADELVELFTGYDAVVYALGPDDRETPPRPAGKFFNERLVHTTTRATAAARTAGVRNLVVMGSYFTFLDRSDPERGLADRHPYIRSRYEQQRQSLMLATNDFSVAILEIPYVFGLVPNRAPLWAEVLVPRLNQMRRWIFFPPGGTAMTSARYVGEAARAAIEHEVTGPLPIAEQNMEWEPFLAIVSEELYGKSRRVITVPGQLAALYGIGQQVMLRLKGLDSGLRYRHYLANVQSRQSFIPQPIIDEVSEQLGIEPGGIEPALRETFAQCRTLVA